MNFNFIKREVQSLNKILYPFQLKQKAILKTVIPLFALLFSMSVQASFPFVFGGVNDSDPNAAVDIDSNSDNPESMAFGNNGYLYIGGDFLGKDINFSANFSLTTSLVTSALDTSGEYSDDGFISAYSNGSLLTWIIAFQGAGTDNVNQVVVGEDGNIYATGKFRSSGAGPMKLNRISTLGVVTQLGTYSTADDSTKAFIAKFSPNGTLIWFKVLDGTTDGESEGSSIATDANNNVYVVGEFFGEIDFDPSINQHLVSSIDAEDDDNSDGFIVKLDTTGAFQWAKTLGSENDDEEIDSIIVDRADSVIYVGGTFESDSDGINLDDNPNDLEFDPQPAGSSIDGSGASSGGQFALVQKLNAANGNLIWSRVFLADATKDESYSSLSALTYNPADKSVFIVGDFDGTVDFNPALNSVIASSSAGGYDDFDAFIVKLDVNGNYVWHGVLGNENGVDETTEGIDAVHFNNDLLYVSGDYSGLALQGAGTANNIANWAANIPSSNGDQDAFLLQLNANDGSFKWVRNIGGTDYDTGDSFAQDSASNIYFAGQFKNTIDLDPSAGILNKTTQDGVGSGGRDAFVVKLSEKGDLVTPVGNLPTISAPPADFEILKNTNVSLDLSNIHVGNDDNNPITLYIIVQNGTLSFTDNGNTIGAGVSVRLFSPQVITLTSNSVDDINDYLDLIDNIKYQTPPNTVGNDVLYFAVDDGRGIDLNNIAGLTTISIKANVKPIANAKVLAAYLEENQWGKVDGSLSSDADGDALTFKWKQLEGPKLIVLKNNESFTFITPYLAVKSKVVMQLVVNDGMVDSDPITVDFFINPAGLSEPTTSTEVIKTSSSGGSMHFIGLLLLMCMSLKRLYTK